MGTAEKDADLLGIRDTNRVLLFSHTSFSSSLCSEVKSLWGQMLDEEYASLIVFPLFYLYSVRAAVH